MNENKREEMKAHGSQQIGTESSNNMNYFLFLVCIFRVAFSYANRVVRKHVARNFGLILFGKN